MSDHSTVFPAPGDLVYSTTTLGLYGMYLGLGLGLGLDPRAADPRAAEPSSYTPIHVICWFVREEGRPMRMVHQLYTYDDVRARAYRFVAIHGAGS